MSEQGIKTVNGQRIAIVDGLRTPFAKQATAFHGVTAIELGALVVNELINRNDLAKTSIQQLVFGQVIQMPEAPNIAREIALVLGMQKGTDAYSVSRACATSFRSTASVCQAMIAGDIDIAIAGGADSSSVAPIGVSKNMARCLLDFSKARSLSKKLKIIKKLSLKDLLPVPPAIAEYSTGLSMGQTAEQMAKTYGISREQQDEFAHRSHSLAAQAWLKEVMAEQVMTAYTPPFHHDFSEDNCIRHDSELENYHKLKPVFDRKYGSVTAANSSPLTDGASALLLMTENKAKTLGFKPLGFIKSYAFTAIDVWQDMLMGPSYATPIALKKAGVTLKDIDVIEMHEAFAAQALANIQMFASKQFAKEKLGSNKAIGEIDMDKLNVHGGSLAYGHPFAATGARLITQALHELKRTDGDLALTTACAAGGLGAAMVLERA